MTAKDYFPQNKFVDTMDSGVHTGVEDWRLLATGLSLRTRKPTEVNVALNDREVQFPQSDWNDVDMVGAML
jgi:hypothetical protein